MFLAVLKVGLRGFVRLVCVVSGCWVTVSVLCILSCGLLAVSVCVFRFGVCWYNIDCVV